MKQKNENLFYVGIENPNEARKALLESLKSIIQLLKSYESLNSVREEKRMLAAKLKEKIAEISRMIARLKSEFPKPEFKEISVPKKAAAKPEEAPAPKVIVHKRLSEVERFERELSDIEQRLRSLG